jgi:hypothetical protein
MFKGTRLLLSLLLLCGACLDEPECFSLNNNIIGITFKKIEDGTASPVTFTSITALGNQTIFGATSNKVYLPLNYFRDTTSFVFVQETRTDTLRFHYTAKAQFVSVECGERYVLSDLDTIRQTFDSLRFIGRTPGRNASVNNIEIYN